MGALGIVGAGIGYKEKNTRIYNLSENDWKSQMNKRYFHF
jgi:hypothetical protein